MLVTLTGIRANGGYTGDTTVPFQQANVSNSTGQPVTGFTVSGYPSTVIINSSITPEVSPAAINATVTFPDTLLPGTQYSLQVVYDVVNAGIDQNARYNGSFTIPCNLTASVAAPIGRGSAGGTWNGSAQVFTSGGTAPLTYAWTISGGTITGGQGTAAITFSAPVGTVGALNQTTCTCTVTDSTTPTACTASANATTHADTSFASISSASTSSASGGGGGGSSASGVGASSASGVGASSASGVGASSASGVGASSASGVGASSASGVGASSVSGVGASSASGVGASSASGVGASSASGVGASSASGVGASSVSGGSGGSGGSGSSRSGGSGSSASGASVGSLSGTKDPGNPSGTPYGGNPSRIAAGDPGNPLTVAPAAPIALTTTLISGGDAYGLVAPGSTGTIVFLPFGVPTAQICPIPLVAFVSSSSSSSV